MLLNHSKHIPCAQNPVAGGYNIGVQGRAFPAAQMVPLALV